MALEGHDAKRHQRDPTALPQARRQLPGMPAETYFLVRCDAAVELRARRSEAVAVRSARRWRRRERRQSLLFMHAPSSRRPCNPVARKEFLPARAAGAPRGGARTRATPHPSPRRRDARLRAAAAPPLLATRWAPPRPLALDAVERHRPGRSAHPPPSARLSAAAIAASARCHRSWRCCAGRPRISSTPRLCIVRRVSVS